MSGIDIFFWSITLTNFGQLSKPGTVSESACPEDSGSKIWPRFAWVNEGQRQS